MQLEVNATFAAMRADEAAIDALFSKYRCTHAYIDVGTNLGVQPRKLYEPKVYASQFEKSSLPALTRLHALFHKHFGSPEDLSLIHI